MKRKLFVLFFGFILLISCKQTSSNYVVAIPASQEEAEEISLADEQKREVYLRSLMNVESTLVEDEKIESDLLNILQGLKEKEEAQKIVPTLQKVNNNLFGLSDVSFFSTDGEEIKENIKLSLYKLESGEKSGFAITCNDLRVGEILALVEEGEFNEDNPFIKLISSNIKAHIDETVKDWYELKNKDDEYKQRSVWEDIVTSKKYRYEKWKVNSKSSPRFLLKTKWEQRDIYNDVIVKLKGGDFPAGCVTVAVAQLMAFHEYPNNYYGTNWESFDSIKSSIDNLCPVLAEGVAVNKKTETDGKETFKKVGHEWVIDGYCNLTCDAVHKETGERKTITADYVHCNAGWDGWYNGYYISSVFTFGIGGKATVGDNEIRSLWPGSNNHYKYNIKICPNLIPKSKLGTHSEYPWNYHWEALW